MFKDFHIKSLLVLFVSIFLFIGLESCHKKSDQPADTIPADSLKNDSLKIKNDSLKAATGGVGSFNGNCFAPGKIAEYLGKGAGVQLSMPMSSFDVTNLITSAKYPDRVIVDANHYNIWSISEFIEKGAKIMIPSQQLSSFEILSLIDNARTKSNITILACKSCSEDVYSYLSHGVKVIISSTHTPFHILRFIDAGKID